MTRQWFKAMAPDVIGGLLDELIAEAGEEERISILFNLLQNCIGMAAHGAQTGQSILQRDGVIGAVSILSFLRDHLRKDSANPANGVLRRFYQAAHRQIIKAHRDAAVTRFHEIRNSIAKVIQKPYSSSFFYNCMQETRMNRAEMLNLMLSFEVRHSICRIDHSMRMFADDEESSANG
jgi:hypothetical protein